MNSKVINSRAILLILVSIVLIATFSLFVLEKTQVINLYSKPKIAVSTEAPRPVNNVIYSPASSTDTTEGDGIKQTLIDKANKPTEPTSKVNVSLSAANQDMKGGPLIVRAIVDTNGGTCNLSLSQGSINKNYSAEVINLGTYYGCKGFDIPVSDISDGEWQLTLKVSNDSVSGEANQKVVISI